MKKLTMCLLAAVAISLGQGSIATAAIEVEGDAYVGIFDKYLWRGFDLSGSQPVVQGGIDLSTSGFTLSYWTNVQLSSDEEDGFTAGEMTETDIILDYSFGIGELVSVSVGDIFYIVEEDWPNTHELYLSVGLNTLLEPSATVYYDWDECEEDGLFYTLSIGHSIAVTESIGVGLGALVSYNQENDFNIGDYEDWHNFEVSVNADYAVTKQVTFSGSILYSEPLSDDAEDIGGIDGETLVGLTATLTF